MRVALQFLGPCLFCCLFLVLFPFAIYSQVEARNDSSFHPVLNPSLDVHRRQGAITIDGDLNDPGWQHAAHMEDFTCCSPHPNTRPSCKTEAYVTYDEDALYVAMIAHDPDPSAIRATLTARDKIVGDDFMGIILDTYGSAEKAFELYTNPRGIEWDLFWTSTNEDDTYDMIYDAEAKITEQGWQMEMRIPFSSLRFPNVPSQNFHIAFWRSYPRDVVYKFSSSPIDFRLPCWFCQLGALKGIESVKPGGNLELLPSLVASEYGAIPSDLPQFYNEPVQVKPSLGLRYGFGPASGIEATINPDFSQVEADAAQVGANTTFALYYPEHRPFFQDGADLFQTPISAVYTRSINDPAGAVKVLHRDSTLSIALLSGYDRHSPVIIPLEEKSIVLDDRGSSFASILRISRKLGTDSYVGALATDREFTSSSNRVAGIDSRLRIYENVAFVGQMLWSDTHEPSDTIGALDGLFDGGRHSIQFDGERFAGTAISAALERQSPTIDATIRYQETSPTFRAGTGFISTNDIHTTSASTQYKLPLLAPPSWLAWLVEVDPNISWDYNWNFDGIMKRHTIAPHVNITTIGQSNFQLSYNLITERYHDILFTNLPYWELSWSTAFDKHITLGGDMTVGKQIARNADVPFAGNGTYVYLSGKFKMLGGFIIEPDYTFSQLNNPDGSVFFAGSIYHTRFTYQFTRSLDARVVVQYDGFSRQLEADPLVRYTVNPFTSFFIGSTHDFVQPDPTGPLYPTSRQFFAKLQYLIQT